MEYVNFSTPPYPHFIIAGSALYRPGDAHGRRSNIGIFDLIFIEYGELYITDGDTAYHLRENELLILKPDSTHYSHKKWRKRLNLTGFISEVWEIINTPGNSIW
ncbi:MAG: hypothetical protein ACLRMZ_12055 [Blautia marasmi]